MPTTNDDCAATAGIAIVGMHVRVPGATSLAQFWSNLRDGVESITFFSDEELRTAGVDEATLANPDYVKALGRLTGIDLFDAAFFNLTPREAEILDPQHRLLLEGVWRALEHAAIDPERYPGRIGLFGGVGLNGYLLHNLISHPELLESVGGWHLTLSNDKDFATTRVAYKLNLQGPAITMNTACSTSLVATVMAAQSLLSHQCDVVVAGGCSLHLPQDQGYFYTQGGTLSPDGHCRPFDSHAAGTIDGNGCALVVLKRLQDAIEEGDTIHGVIRGFAINNDGSLKVGYSAPSVAGQAEVILEAMEIAGITADAIDYVETHGTATDLGDSVEIAALTEAFRTSSQRVGHCAIGSLKSNVGHLDTAAGVASLIKTVLAMNAGEIPPTCHFQAPNPKLGLPESPFFVNATRIPWPKRTGSLRRAGVSSFGIGGTNAHVIVEEAPPAKASRMGRPWVLLPLAAKTREALAQMGTELADHLDAHPAQSLTDIAHTLQVGRRHFPWRRILVVAADDHASASAQLRDRDVGVQGQTPTGSVAPIFLLPGQDAHCANMALALYRDEPRFRATLEECQAWLSTHHGIDLRSLLYAESPSHLSGLDPLPLYVVNVALAQLWLSWGVVPRALVGYSLGEYVAATLAGVVTLHEGLAIAVAARQLLQTLKPGRMIAVWCSASELQPRLPPNTYLAMVIGPQQVVAAGTEEAIATLIEQLKAVALQWQPVPLTLPFHTPLMEPFLAPFAKVLREIRFQEPKIPYLCSVTGHWITASEATDPSHYLRLATTTVRLDRMLERLFADLGAANDGVLLEVGPSQVLTALVSRHPQRPADLAVFSSLPDPRHAVVGGDQAHLLGTAGRLWIAGVALDWSALADSERCVAIPGHPLTPQRFWIDPVPVRVADTEEVSDTAPVHKEPDIGRWFYVPGFRRLPPARAVLTPGSRWLIIYDAAGLAKRLTVALQAANTEVVAVFPSTGPLQGSMAAGYCLDCADPNAVQALFTALGDWRPQQIVHLALYQSTLFPGSPGTPGALAFDAMVALASAMGKHYFSDEITLTLVADRLCAVDSANTPDAAKATALGPLRVMAQEYPNLATRMIDLDGAPRLSVLVAELAEEAAPRTVALRGTIRLRESFEPSPLPVVSGIPARLRQDGVYLITGGLGNIGLALAHYFAKTLAAKLVLVSRTPLPARSTWLEHLANPTTPLRLSNQLRRLLSIEAAGGELLICSADVAEESAMGGVLVEAEQRFGTLHGVIHAAGLVGEDSFVTLGDACNEVGLLANRRQFPSKVNGIEVLASLLAGRAFDFCLVCSSLSPMLGGLGFAAYAATNLYVDARIEQLNLAQPGQWLAVNWEGWMFEAPDQPPDQPKGMASALELGMTATEGCEAFARLMEWPSLERIILSSGDLQRRLAQWVERKPKTTSTKSGHARSELLGECVAPRNATERELTTLWEQLLGIDGIGVEDSFFELGGNSLLLTQLVAMMRRTFRVELALGALFGQPTVAAIAALIDRATNGEEERDEGFL